MAFGINSGQIFRSKTTWIVLLVVALIVSGATAVQVWRLSSVGSEQDTEDVTPATIENSAVVRASAIADEATVLADDGDYDAANDLIDEQLKDASTPDEKYVLLIAKSNLSKSNPAEGINQAIEYALQADAENQTYKSAALVARLYEEAGDKTNAILYYQKTIDRKEASTGDGSGTSAPEGSTKSGEAGTDTPKSYYQIRIDELSA